jgi:hypothetical protein
MKNFRICNLDERFHNETVYKILELLYIKGIGSILNNIETIAYYLKLFHICL